MLARSSREWTGCGRQSFGPQTLDLYGQRLATDH